MKGARSREPGLGGNVAWTLAGNAGYAVCQWGLLAVMAKSASAEALGVFAYGLAFSAPVMVFANLHLRAVQATDAADASPFGLYLGLRLLTSAGALAVIAAMAIAFGYRGAPLATILGIAVAKVSEAVSDVIFGRLQQRERMRQIAVSMLAKGVLSVAAVAAAVWLTSSVATAAFALAGAWVTTLLVIDLPAVAAMTDVRPRLDRQRTLRLAWLAVPLGGVMALGSLTVNVPRYAVQSVLGPVGLGHFAAMAYLLTAAGQFVVALGMAMTPRLARAYATGGREYERLVRRALVVAAAFALVLLLGAAVLGPEMLATLYAPEYAAEFRTFVWMVLASGVGFVGSVLGFATTAARRFRAQFVVAVLALAAAFVTATLLVPRHGLVGAAWAVLATEAVRVVGLTCLYGQGRRRRAGHREVGSVPGGRPLPAEVGVRG